MYMKKILFIFVAAIAVLSSCSKTNVDQKSDNDTSITKGVAQATINGQNVLVKWVQLWENGPKFAEYNVGVTDGNAESVGVCQSFYVIVNNFIPWGSNWRLPTKEEFQGLIDNCSSQWTWDVAGRKYTGKGDYSENSIFFPATSDWSYGDSEGEDYQCGRYWSSITSDYFYFDFYSTSGNGMIAKNNRVPQYLARLVLAE